MNLLASHLIGDFILQNDWMQAKSKSTVVCLVHICCYAIPFALLVVLGKLTILAGAFILVEHFLQDRFALHLKWMRLYRQTPPDRWPVGPLCIDQSFHLAFIALFAALFPVIQ